jgi:hypothetical protein
MLGGEQRYWSQRKCCTAGRLTAEVVFRIEARLDADDRGLLEIPGAPARRMVPKLVTDEDLSRFVRNRQTSLPKNEMGVSASLIIVQIASLQLLKASPVVGVSFLGN